MSTSVTHYLIEIGFIGHTTIPETSKFTNNYKVGMHSNPISLSAGSYGYINLLNFDTKTKLSKTTNFQFQNPIDKFKTITSGIKANSMCLFEGRVFYCSFETSLSFATANDSKLDIKKNEIKIRCIYFCFVNRINTR